MGRGFLNIARTGARQVVPACIRGAINRWTGNITRYEGVYTDWSLALASTEGYAATDILTYAEQAGLEVCAGHGAWDQDGTVFTTLPPALAYQSLLGRIAAERKNQLCLLDYGGALGSSYRRVRAAMFPNIDLRWHIVEQEHFVERGLRLFANEELQFHASLQEALAVCKPDVILLSSVLQYLEKPYALLEEILEAQVSYLIIDRTPSSDTRELLTVQVVPASLHKARYPSWLFDWSRIQQVLGVSYVVDEHWVAADAPVRGSGVGAHFVGASFRRRRS